MSPDLSEELVVPLLGETRLVSSPLVAPPDVPDLPAIKEKDSKANSQNFLS